MLEFINLGKNILGMNARNLTYVRPYNLKKAKRLADNKIRSKKLLRKNNIPVPRLIAQVSSYKTLENFDYSILPPSFVLKPNNGLGGSGIVVVYARKKGRDDAWVKADGSIITIKDLNEHIRNILDGGLSISNSPDIAFFEERLQSITEFKPYSYKGVPDIRIIVFNKVPVMAMLRVPTKESGGKANLNQGGIGIGIDMAKGVTTTAVQGHGKMVEYVPHSRLMLSGLKIPHWNEILKLAVKAQVISKLGYLGADVAIDRRYGPVFFELNARPGLEIQVANMAGLKKRLERVAGLKIKSVERGVMVGKNLFGGEIEEELESTSGKKVIGSVEEVVLIGLNKKQIKLEAKIDTGAYSTSIDRKLAIKLGYGDTVKAFDEINLSQYNIKRGKCFQIEKQIFEEYKDKISNLNDVAVIFSSSGSSIRPVIKANFILDKKRITAKINIVDRADLKYDMIIGKRNLNQFLIDVSR
jgi:alpha-L-glutamate ligase-like protein